MSAAANIVAHAADELKERRAKLAAMVEQCQAEIKEIDAMLQAMPVNNGNGDPARVDKRNGSRERKAKDGRYRSSQERKEKAGERATTVAAWVNANAVDAPVTKEQIAEGTGIPVLGMHATLRGLKTKGKIAEPEDDLWLSVDSPVFETWRENHVPRAAG